MTLPGGDFDVAGVGDLLVRIKSKYPFLAEKDAVRLLRTYGTEVFDVLGDAQSEGDLGQAFGAGISAAELDWAKRVEWVQTGEDFLWRRTKLGLRLTEAERDQVGAYLEGTVTAV